METGARIDVNKLRLVVIEHLEKTGKSRRALSMEASDGRNPDVVRDLFRVDKRVPLYDSIVALARAIDREPAEFVFGISGAIGETKTWLPVKAEVEAGVFRETSDWPPDDWYEIQVEPSDVPGEHTGFVVRGRSMDKVLPPGTILRCVPIMGNEVELQDGDYAIVERRRHSLVETTCKRISRNAAGEWELIAESTLPEYRYPIKIGKPIDTLNGPGFEFDDFEGIETSVRALVVDAYLPLTRREKRPFYKVDY